MELSVPHGSSGDVPSGDMPSGDVPSRDMPSRGPTSADIGDHEGPWTEAEHLALATRALVDRRGRVELLDGALLLGPVAARVELVEQLRATIAGALPGGLRVAGRAALRLAPGCVLLPDLVVTRAPVATHPDADPDHDPDPDPDHDAGPQVLDAADALLVVEVVGREHGSPYRLSKPQLYARSRIPYSVLVDHDAAFGVADMLINGRYHEYARSTDGAVLVVEEPFPLRIPLVVATAPTG